MKKYEFTIFEKNENNNQLSIFDTVTVEAISYVKALEKMNERCNKLSEERNETMLFHCTREIK